PGSAPPPMRSATARPGRGRLRVVGGRGHQPAAGTPRQRLIAAAKTVGILVAFVALLVVLHLLGFGPQ
ncbi:MAG: hypothetical protein ACR2FU_23335, partial [Streptosporangiaceae bacterium]